MKLISLLAIIVFSTTLHAAEELSMTCQLSQSSGTLAGDYEYITKKIPLKNERETDGPPRDFYWASENIDSTDLSPENAVFANHLKGVSCRTHIKLRIDDEGEVRESFSQVVLTTPNNLVSAQGAHKASAYDEASKFLCRCVLPLRLMLVKPD